MAKKLLSSAMEARKQELQKELNKLQIIEEQEVINQYYPAIRKKYEGKCFKYQNRYSTDDSWWLYFKVLEIKPEDVYDTNGNGVTSHFRGWSFQTDIHGMITIEQEKNGYVHSLGKQISEAEFNRAYNKMIEKMNTLK